jgi:hypothetical protein
MLHRGGYRMAPVEKARAAAAGKGRCPGFHLRPVLLDIQKDALRLYRERGVGRELSEGEV